MVHRVVPWQLQEGVDYHAHEDALVLWKILRLAAYVEKMQR